MAISALSQGDPIGGYSISPGDKIFITKRMARRLHDAACPHGQGEEGLGSAVPENATERLAEAESSPSGTGESLTTKMEGGWGGLSPRTVR